MSGAHHPPDAAERGVRFGCGFIAGGILAFGYVLHGEAGDDGPLAIALVVAGGVVMGIVSALTSDRFWKWLARSGDWWP